MTVSYIIYSLVSLRKVLNYKITSIQDLNYEFSAHIGAYNIRKFQRNRTKGNISKGQINYGIKERGEYMYMNYMFRYLFTTLAQSVCSQS